MENISQASSEINDNQEQLKQRLNRVIKASWDEFYQTIIGLSAGYEIGACLKLLNVADELLNQGNDFSQSSVVERYLIGGVKDNKAYNNYPFGAQLLGDMQSFASFKKLLNKDPAGLAKLLKVIPTNGPVDGWHFMQFVDEFKQLFESNGFKQAYVFPATRLLSMKRPDQFLALDQITGALFCQALAIKPLKNQDFQRYWDEIIVPIQKSPWFKADQPMDPAQLPIHRSRFALLERLVCTPIVLSETENQTSALSGETHSENKAQSITIEQNETDSLRSADLITNFIREKPVETKKVFVQPKKLTIVKKKSAKLNKDAATKLMSQYYFANKEKFGKVDMSKNREIIINKLIEGASVEETFAELL